MHLPQTNGTWMDGDRLTYVSGGKLIVFDYDNQNLRVLTKSSPNLLAYFSPDYSNLYSLVPSSSTPAQTILTQTSLIAK